MPSNWLSVDNNFPSFTGKENPTDQIRALHNYLFCLKNELKYTLQNLTADNWNTAAWESMTADTQNAIANQLGAMGSQISELKQIVEQLQGRVTDMGDLAARITAVEENDSYIEQRVVAAEGSLTELQETAADHEQRIFAQEQTSVDMTQQITDLQISVDDLDTALSALQKVVEDVLNIAEDGSATIGKADGKLYLVGEVYLNGVLLEQGGTNETA